MEQKKKATIARAADLKTIKIWLLYIARDLRHRKLNDAATMCDLAARSVNLQAERVILRTTENATGSASRE